MARVALLNPKPKRGKSGKARKSRGRGKRHNPFKKRGRGRSRSNPIGSALKRLMPGGGLLKTFALGAVGFLGAKTLFLLNRKWTWGTFDNDPNGTKRELIRDAVAVTSAFTVGMASKFLGIASGEQRKVVQVGGLLYALHRGMSWRNLGASFEADSFPRLLLSDYIMDDGESNMDDLGDPELDDPGMGMAQIEDGEDEPVAVGVADYMDEDGEFLS